MSLEEYYHQEVDLFEGDEVFVSPSSSCFVRILTPSEFQAFKLHNTNLGSPKENNGNEKTLFYIPKGGGGK